MSRKRPDLKDMLESIVLDVNELNRLKKLIFQVASGNSDEKMLREEILKSRIGIVKELMQFFPFFAGVKKDVESTSDLQQALKEREELLKNLSKRLHKIYNQLV
jgi:5-bromo-4-chloroindolyl phosphate hydrolysis protein